ncbi:MAG: hypothetical protein Q9191_000844 [Dirinaria sp. TL-2023a]
MTRAELQWSSSSERGETIKFPSFDQSVPSEDILPTLEEERDRVPSPRPLSKANGSAYSDRWQHRRDNHIAWDEGPPRGLARHKRQPSLSDAIRTIRTRRGSVSANAQEIAEALKAPISFKLIVSFSTQGFAGRSAKPQQTLCIIWYISSALTNTSSKSILNIYPKPITLTLVQFAFVSSWCVFFAYLAHLIPPIKSAIPALRYGIRYPSRDVIATTFPLALFQIGGHILSSEATEKIPVSLVHTIKGLSPLFTVLAYRFFFRIRYGTATYLSLIPLTLGVVLACSVEFSGNLIGIFCAFGGALVFVTQNIFSKKLFNEAARAEADGASAQSRKLDKLNLLCYCSGLAFLLTLPIWIWSDGLPMLLSYLQDSPLSQPTVLPPTAASIYVPVELFFNGVSHFAQNILAFILLSMVSPVTYSVASLIKRVVVITFSILWFGSRTTPIQAAGITLTFVGLYLYDRTSDASKADRKAKMDQMKIDPLLPLAAGSAFLSGHAVTETPISTSSGHLFAGNLDSPMASDTKKAEAGGSEKPLDNYGVHGHVRLPPNGRQEGPWKDAG